MELRRFISSRITRLAQSPRRRALARRIAELRRRLRGAPHRVEYFHQVDDPYSQLAVQVLASFTSAYAIELLPRLVGPPPAAAAAERELLVAYSRRDAADIAPYYGLRFVDSGAQPDPARTRLAQRILARALESPYFARLACEVGDALWSSDPAALERLAQQQPPLAESLTEAALEQGNQRRRRLRHYLGAMFWYAGEWYWGIDRLHHLERRLIELGASRSGERLPRFVPPLPRKSERRGSGQLTLEFFLSLRSPYTYISMRRTYELARRTGVRLELRPVMPMVMRGLPVPLAKGLYIVKDTKREAELLGVDFGRIAEPVGRPVERAFSLYPWARAQGRAEDFLLSFAQAAFADGIDTSNDTGLRRVVERAGLSWSEALAIIDNEDWKPELEANRAEMFAAGVWGVPSFRLRGPAGEPDFVTWGQDRLWRVEDEIARRSGPAS